MQETSVFPDVVKDMEAELGKGNKSLKSLRSLLSMSLHFLTGLMHTRVTENMLLSPVNAGLHSRHSLVSEHLINTTTKKERLSLWDVNLEAVTRTQLDPVASEDATTLL